MPGGLGTLDQAFETLTLMQCHKLERFPIVAMGKDFWEQLGTFVRGALVSEKTISAEDLKLLQVTDSVEDAVRLIREGVVRMVPATAID